MALRGRRTRSGRTPGSARVVGHTRLRALPAMAVGFAALTGLHQLVSAEVLAVNFTTADQQFKIYSNYVQGLYGAGFVGRNNGASTTSQVGVAELGFKEAKLSGLCAISQQNLLGVGTVSLIITAGAPVRAAFDDASLLTTDGAGMPVSLDADGRLTGASLDGAVGVADMFLNSDGLTGYGNRISGLNLGQDGSSVGPSAGITWPTSGGGTAPAEGAFGLFSRYLNIAGLDGGSYGINLAGQVSLPGLRVTVLPGVRTQADCPTEAQSS
ncbi:MAG TPA: DUF6230 family protein [Nocardioides sp.]|uniref:DUF6230 family protein n=1 Tax=Nocardioides sp. TaxID=35761 RepID=UPI002ED90030